MRICICTTPIRPVPTTFPPLGSMAIIQSLRKIGEEASFYNIDYFRPRHEQVKSYFAENRFDIVGISAVVSTAYAYTKYLADLIRGVSPDTTIVVGGNLAASAEILLRKCQVDFCVVGDGELTVQELVRALYEEPWDYDRLKSIRGIAFLDENEQFYFTGYGVTLSAEEIEFPDWDILEADGSLPYFITDKIPWDHRARPESHGKRYALVQTDKGCVVRCTFCHRFERGYRVRPVDRIIEHIQYLQERYNVGFIGFATENFGSDREAAHELVTYFGKMGIAWRAGAVRVRSVDPEILKYWKANGCTAVYYGIESGSQKILDVMEKKATVQMNIDALRWTYEAGLYSIVQLVLGMPGETDETIRETTDFLKTVTPYLFLENGDHPSAITSINYAQALPGTPLYEYARQHGFIGKTLEEEEAYLVQISDIDAYATDHFVNYTGQPLLKVLLWRHWMTGEVDAHYMRHTLGISLSLPQVVGYYTRGVMRKLVNWWMPARANRLLSSRALSIELTGERSKEKGGGSYTESGYFNIKPTIFAPLFLNPITRRFFYPLIAFGVAFYSADSIWQGIRLIAEHVGWSLTRRFRPASDLPDQSLRKVVEIEPAVTAPDGEDMMIPLRMGR